MRGLYIRTCPYCGGTASFEKALYDPSGRQLRATEPHNDWIGKCSDCGARTDYKPSRLAAVIAWNQQEFSEMTYRMNRPGHIRNTATWEAFAGAIFRMAYDDYKEAVINQMKYHKSGALPGEHWLAKSNPYLRKRAHEEAPYDIWKDEMDCRHCAMKEYQCQHKRNNLYREFKRHTAPPCPRREGDDST